MVAGKIKGNICDLKLYLTFEKEVYGNKNLAG